MKILVCGMHLKQAERLRKQHPEVDTATTYDTKQDWIRKARSADHILVLPEYAKHSTMQGIGVVARTKPQYFNNRRAIELAVKDLLDAETARLDRANVRATNRVKRR